ncbi:Zona pellucida-like domain-containing protein 1 [Merluccius polli]|uniref:Zona pellucida-like domain-containing protein 1 n=1 Tax=Merluccius polli TaxID=89951 RepID=A0AA47MUT6_MERPO|nr:Zona pellucida-like domain-containing protein 1 [Merluccius polli]
MLLRLCLPLVVMLVQPALSLYNCPSLYDRVPDNDDLMVDCGTVMITLEVNLCTAQWAGYNETGLALNGEHTIPECLGAIDTSVDPAVIRYQLPVNHSQANPCRQSLQIVDESPDPAGPFGHFSSIQSVIITGLIDTPGSSAGMISYTTDVFYHFSCRYPLEYLLNNTQIIASSVSVATSDNNGTFIDTLRMMVYNVGQSPLHTWTLHYEDLHSALVALFILYVCFKDTNYKHQLLVPVNGLELRTQIYVDIKAVNLTGNFHVFMDHCFATSTPFNLNQTEQHNFFVSCAVDQRVSITANGVSNNARFNFEAFRFVEHRDQEKSNIYLHCILRLCEPTKCKELIQACSSRRKRSDRSKEGESEELATVSFGPLTVAKAASESPAGNSNTGVVLGAVFGSAAVTLAVVAIWMAVKKYYVSGASLRAFN